MTVVYETIIFCSPPARLNDQVTSFFPNQSHHDSMNENVLVAFLSVVTGIGERVLCP